MKPPNKGKHYTDEEINLLVWYWYRYDGKVPRHCVSGLATSLKRGVGAIDWLFRQITEGEVIGSDPDKARNRIQSQIVKAKARQRDARRAPELELPDLSEPEPDEEVGEAVLKQTAIGLGDLLKTEVEKEVERRVEIRVEEFRRDKENLVSTLKRLQDMVDQTVSYWRGHYKNKEES